jgi:hypothetical protein
MGLWNQTTPLRRLWNALPQDELGGTKHTFNGEWVTIPVLNLKVYTGDVVLPSVINLFRRAWNEDPSMAGDHNGPGGEWDLEGNAGLRAPPALQDRDDTGNDLDLIVMLLMSILRFPFSGSTTPPIQSTDNQVKTYSKNRLVSYGSYRDAYLQAFGDDILTIPFTPEVKSRLDNNIANWTTDASRVMGAVRWYHRQSSGANPKLADLYEPIIRAYFE